MKDFTKTESDEELYFTLKSDEENKPKKTLKSFIPLYLLVIAAGMWGVILSDFYKSSDGDTNIKDKKNYYFQTNEYAGIFSRRTFTAGKFDEKAWVSFYQRNLLGEDYYCTDETRNEPNVLDGLADEVEIGRKEFLRENDYQANKEIFHKADQHIAEAKNILENRFLEEIN